MKEMFSFLPLMNNSAIIGLSFLLLSILATRVGQELQSLMFL